MANASAPSQHSLILIPALITLGVTALRLLLEFAAAPAWLSNAAAGGGGAVIGIAWLPALFGPWFLLRLRPHAPDRRALFGRLAKTLLAYGVAARLPVFLITIPAVLGEWGTHYEKFPFEAGVAAKIGAAFLAQMLFWAGLWTVGVGTLAALIVSVMIPGERHPGRAST